MRAATAVLVAEEITYDDIGQPVRTETEREIMCTVSGITRTEWAEAGKLGMDPQVKLITPAFNYNGERTVIFEGKRYGVYRTFVSTDRLELYLEKKAGK